MKKYKNSVTDPLGQAIQALRHAELAREGELGADRRAAIVSSAYAERREASERAEARPRWRSLVAAAVIPSVVLGVGMIAWQLRGNDGTRVAPGALTVTKRRGEIIFSVAGGGSAHTVQRSTTASLFDGRNAVRLTHGSYVDRVDDGSDIVFYKID